MDLLRFTTESYAEVERLRAWGEALGRLGLRSDTVPARRALHGSIKSRTSASGFELSVLASVAQTLELKASAADNLLIALNIDGEATLLVDGVREPVAANDIVYLSSREPASLTFASDFRAFVVRVPRAAVSARLLAQASARAGRIAGEAGIGHVFAGFLQSIAESVETLSADELRPLELALAEFLVASLAGHEREGSFNGLTSSQAAIFSRVRRIIEARLGDPDISLAQIAKEERVSPRYLQKLFETTGQSFSTHLRSRRLERCRADLVDPLYEKMSISDICFRWGFNDPAHFSRVFREQYQASPRTFRHEAGLELARHLVRRISRGLPVNAEGLLMHVQQGEPTSARRRPKSAVPAALAAPTAPGVPPPWRLRRFQGPPHPRRPLHLQSPSRRWHPRCLRQPPPPRRPTVPTRWSPSRRPARAAARSRRPPDGAAARRAITCCARPRTRSIGAISATISSRCSKSTAATR